MSAHAQAPTEERVAPGGNRVAQGQQRLEFLRRDVDGDQDKVARAELEYKDAQSHEAVLQKQLEAARKRREATGLSLNRARQELAVSRKAFESESTEFERMLKGGAIKGARDPAAEK